MTLRTVLGVVVCCIAASVLSPASADANTIHVLPGTLISDALTSAAAGDTILISCGTYNEQGLQMVGGVTLRSESGTPDCVTIASAGTNSILTCENLDGMTRIEGITFTAAAGGMTTDVSYGGGMLITNSSPLITDCVFENLTADYGGAVYCGAEAAPMFSGTTFIGNSARAVGGALNCVGLSSPTLGACLLVDNSAAAGGHALNAASGSTPRIIACTLDANTGNGGPALMSWDNGAIQVNNTIAVGSVWLGDPSATPSVACSDFYADGIDVWTGLLADQADVNGNFSADPQFCGASGGDLPYTLVESSPCLEAAGCGQIGAFTMGCTISGVPDDDIPQPETMLVTGLNGNYPNPFNPSTTIKYNVRTAGMISISVYDIAGRLVNRLLDGVSPAGSHEIQWQGTDHNNRSCATGVYFVQLKAGLVQDTSRLSLIK